jgi:hypothetical protein
LKIAKNEIREDHSKTDGIDTSEIQRRRSWGECLRCAWPADRKGFHRVKECRRPIKLDKGTAIYPTVKGVTKVKNQQPSVEEDSSEDTSSEESSDDSLSGIESTAVRTKYTYTSQ